MAEIGVDRVARPDKLVMVVDHTTSPAMGSPYHQIHREVKDFAERNKVVQFHGPGSGLRHLVLTEKGLARPGTLVFSDEPNIASIGALGALNIPVSWEVIVTLIGDENWVSVPKSARFDIRGRLAPGAAGTDDGASDVVVTTLQYQDICSQLVAHLRERLARTGALVEGLHIPFEAAMAATRGDPTTIALASSRVNNMEAMLADTQRATSSGPVQQAQVGCGDVELF